MRRSTAGSFFKTRRDATSLHARPLRVHSASTAKSSRGFGGDAYAAVVVNRGVFMSCMGARGYIFDPNGSLAALPGTEIRMVE